METLEFYKKAGKKVLIRAASDAQKAADYIISAANMAEQEAA